MPYFPPPKSIGEPGMKGKRLERKKQPRGY